MTRMRFRWWVPTLIAISVTHCNGEIPRAQESTGAAEIALTNGPTGIACLRLTVAGASRKEVRKFSLRSGERALFRLNGLPLGDAGFSADAFPVSCDQALSDATPTWISGRPRLACTRSGPRQFPCACMNYAGLVGRHRRRRYRAASITVPASPRNGGGPAIVGYLVQRARHAARDATATVYGDLAARFEHVPNASACALHP